MQGHAHPDDASIKLSNLRESLQMRFRYANEMRKASKNLGDRSHQAINAMKVAAYAYNMVLGAIERNEDIIRALYKPRHYAAHRELIWPTRQATLKRLSSLTANSSKVKQAS